MAAKKKKTKHQKAKSLVKRKRDAAALLPPKPKKPKALKPDPHAPPDFSIPKSLAQPVKATGLRHAKWPALFKKHIGLLESHIRLVTRMQESLQSEMEGLSEEQRREWELDELGNWRLVCEMLDRARGMLAIAKRTAVNLLPPDVIRDKKGLGLKRFEFEMQGPPLAARAAEEGYVSKKPMSRAESSSSTSESDSDSGSSSEVEEVDDGPSWHQSETAQQDDESVTDTKQDDTSMEDVEQTNGDEEQVNLVVNGQATTNGKEPSPNPYFVIDTNPTPINLNGAEKSKCKKRARDEDGAEQGSKKAKKEKHREKKHRNSKDETDKPEVTPEIPDVDGASEKKHKQSKKDETENPEVASETLKPDGESEKKSSKKRAKEDDSEEKKSKKAKKTKDHPIEPILGITVPIPTEIVDYAAMEAKLQAEVKAGMKAIEEKEKAADQEHTKKKRKRESEGEVSVEKKAKKEKSERKEKKRKAEGVVDGEDGQDGEMKKRRHKVES